MPCILFVGYGNPLRGDDGFGWLLAQRLKKKFRTCDIEVIAAHQLTPELAEPISRARYVIFADATIEQDSGGLCLKKLRAGAGPDNGLSHELCPEALLAMARTVYGSGPHSAFLLTARAYELGYREQLSTEMTIELYKAVDRVVSLCEFLSPGLIESHMSREFHDLLPSS